MVPRKRLAIHAVLLVASVSGQAFNMASKGAYTLFDTPVGTVAPPLALFQPTDALHAWLPPRYVPSSVVGTVAIPTNAWWGNSIASTTDSIVRPMWTNPYSFRPNLVAAPFGLAACYSFPTREFGGATGNGVGTNRYYAHAFVNDLVFSATQFTTATTPAFEVTSWDDLGVSLRFSTSATSKMEATLVSGMALVTAKYSSLTPRFVLASAIGTINGARPKIATAVTSTRFVLTLGNGQKWVIYTGTTVKLTLRNANTLEVSGAFTGYVRAGIVTSDATLAALDKSYQCLLEGSAVEAMDASAYMFRLKTSGDCSSGLFHYLHVHHVDTLDATSASVVSGTTVNSPTRGAMAGVLTKTKPPAIRLIETQKVPVDFYPPRRPSPSVVTAQRIKETLINDLNATWTLPRDGSFYYNGKAVAKVAHVCLVANDEAVTGADKPALTRQCLDKLETLLAPFVNNSWTYPLQYDSAYRGIVSSIGIALKDVNTGYLSSSYDDHHVHYGYWIATAAIVNYLDPVWSGIQQLNRVASALVRDVANPSTNDTFFPKFRQFDWFRGHSLSHGVTPFLDGKDQESCSEDVNFHYAVALYGKATNNTALATVGQLMLKLNARAAQTYFLMASDNRVHPPSIVPNKVTGIFFDNKADYTTWFSAEKHAIHGIQMLPITAVTEFVRTTQFVAEEWDTILSKLPDVVTTNVANPWLSLLYASYATVNSALAMDKLQVVAMDDGLSRTWALYFAATRPQMVTK